ncbi:hypothetical protein VN12_06855 [Pirellula sp. SH-Sr6A]|nr:hypothetical protein VN12_06855 [Pirellula sp. SH-Sr6A]
MEHGAWSMEQGAGSREQGAWSMEHGAGSREQGAGRTVGDEPFDNVDLLSSTDLERLTHHAG